MYFQCCDYFNDDFANKFIPEFQKGLFGSLLNMTGVELRSLTKEWLERIRQHTPKVLQRIYSDRETAKLIESFMLEMGKYAS